MSEHYAHRAKKRLGQHFLHDEHVIGKIVAAIEPQPDEVLVEIGPGPGALTGPLTEVMPHFHVIEIDADAVAHLTTRFPANKLTVHAADVLAFDFLGLLVPHPIGTPLVVVGNLPYNISTPILFALSAIAHRVARGIFMLQREVVDRMAAAPDTDAYGRLSVMLQYRFKVTRLFRVPPGAFLPPPKVDSAIVKLVPLGADRPVARDEQRFAQLVQAAFGQRRKTLTNTLKPWLTSAEISACGIDPKRRGETLAVADYIRLSDCSTQR